MKGWVDLADWSHTEMDYPPNDDDDDDDVWSYKPEYLAFSPFKVGCVSARRHSLHTFIAENDVNIGGHVEHELQRVRLRPENRFAVPYRRPGSRRHSPHVPAVGAAGRRRVLASGQITVDGTGLADRRHSVTHYRCVGRRQAVISSGRDGEVDDGEIDALSWVGVKTPRTVGRAALKVTSWRWRRRRHVNHRSVD